VTMAIHPEARPVCPPTGCHHDALPDPEPPRTGGRCAFPDARHADGLCGAEPVAVYINDAVWPPLTYRCDRHDKDVARERAERMGFTRQAVTR